MAQWKYAKIRCILLHKIILHLLTDNSEIKTTFVSNFKLFLYNTVYRDKIHNKYGTTRIRTIKTIGMPCSRRQKTRLAVLYKTVGLLGLHLFFGKRTNALCTPTLPYRKRLLEF